MSSADRQKFFFKKGLTILKAYVILCSRHGKEGKPKVNRKTKTSTEVKNRWKAKTYKAYQVNLRKEEDAELIAYIESIKDRIGTTDIFRRGVEAIKKEGL